MRPTLEPGQIVMSRLKKPKLGDLVLAQCGGREVIKRVVAINVDLYDLSGDNTASASYQVVPESDILGVIIWPKQKSH